MYCKNCGAKNEDDMSFCSSCGTPLVRPAQPTSQQAPIQAPIQTQTQTQTQTVACTQCGAPIPKGGRFCEKCGTPVAQQPMQQQPMQQQPMQQTVQQPVQQQPVQQPVQQQSTAQTQNSVCTKCGAPIPQGGRFCEKCGTPIGAADASYIPPTPVKEKVKAKKSKGKKIAIISVIVALVAALGVGGYFLWRYFVEKNPINEISHAFANTFEEVENASFTVSANDLELISGEYELDLENKSFSVHVDTTELPAYIANKMDLEKGEIWLRYEDSELEGYTKEDGSSKKAKKISSSDLEEAEAVIAEVFESLDTLGNTEDLKIEDILNELPDDMLDDIRQVCNIDDEKVTKKFFNNLCKESNLKKLFNYEKETDGDETIYSFEPDLEEILDYLKKDKTGFLTDDAIDELNNVDTSELPSGSQIPKISIHVKNELVIGIDVSITGMNISFRLDNINQTKVNFPG